MNDLVLCPSCTRHSRRDETRCPFCGVALSEELRNAPRAPVAPRGLSRAKRYAFQTAIAASMAAACGGLTVGDAGAPEDASNETSTSKDAATKDGPSFGDAQTQDAEAKDAAVKDVVPDFISPPPPYGCVFPEGCGDVKV
jgi:hypothetical protein